MKNSDPAPDSGSIRLRIRSRLEDVALAGYAVKGLCLGCGMGEGDAADVELAVCEAVNNIIRHTGGDSLKEMVDVVVRPEQTQIVVDILDSAGSPVPKEPQEPASVEELPEGGLGLYIIHSLMDAVEHLEQDGRMVTRLRKQVSAPG